LSYRNEPNEPIVNLDNCAREPIHIPGSIQPHGVIFVLAEPDLAVVQVSENCSTVLGLDPAEVLAGGLTGFLNPAQIQQIRFALDSTDPTENNPVPIDLNSVIGLDLDAIVHRFDGFSFLELEISVPVGRDVFVNFYKNVSRATATMQGAKTLGDLLPLAAKSIRTLTGFDRVMIYRFAETFDGQVVAEDRKEDIDPFLGLWYPASDIPVQSRRMYVLSPIRTISDVNYTPVPITPVINPRSDRPTDLSFAGLRSVSPIHCEYLRNMGVASSMSVSILRDGKLWGLIACHHQTPKVLSYETRKACMFLGKILSGEIVRRETDEESAFAAHANATKARFLETMAGATSDPVLSLLDASPNLMDLFSCTGAAYVVGENVHAIGSVPAYSHLLGIAQMMRESSVPVTFAVSSLKGRYDEADHVASVASGIIALTLSLEPSRQILFFRPQLTQVIFWGGNPLKPVIADEDGFRLSPRKSFTAWQEQTHGNSLPWTPAEVRAADDLRNLINVIAMRAN
jgi:chemotaxis family two-component system sensor kinase Cph1